MEGQHTTQKMLDDLLSNRITEAERAKITHDIESDPSLRHEYEFQKDIVEGLQQVRKAELKARLESVAIEPGLIGVLTAVTATKIGGAFLVATGIGFGIYQYMQPDDFSAEITLSEIHPKTEYIELPRLEPGVQPTQIEKFELSGIDQSTLYAAADKNIILEEISTTEAAVAKNEFTPPQVNLPTLSGIKDEEEAPSPKLDKDLSLTKPASKANEYTEVENINDSKYPFHYKFEDNKLFLYGDFKGIPYEILEVYGKNGRNTYLAYQDKYYALRNPQNSVQPLIAIEDKAMIEEIRSLSEQK